MRSFESNHVRTDRFNTLITWEAIKEKWSLDNRFPPVLEMEKKIKELVNRTSIVISKKLLVQHFTSSTCLINLIVLLLKDKKLLMEKVNTKLQQQLS
jgi:hypothetical protein